VDQNSGVYNETKNFVIPFLENARRPYRQLSLIEDAIVIYRLVRAPERLVFNVDVGNMAPPKAEAYLRRLFNNIGPEKRLM
jgi:fibrillarin-like rRNA methylase